MIGLALALWVLGAAGLVAGVLEKVTTFREVHHAYAGTLLCLSAAWPALDGHAVIACVLLWAGALLTLDDGVEHGTAAVEGDPAKAWSPLHSWFVPWLYARAPWFRQLEADLDRLFGKAAP